MSMFSGIIYEYPEIAIDNFNPLVSTYFISHLHLDHIYGIENFSPSDITEIYTSDITAKLILGRHSEFKSIIPYIKPLSLGKSYSIKLKDSAHDQYSSKDIIDVKLISSGHCLGSVMFLIEGKNGRVLYTGDFRLNIGNSTEISVDYKINNLDGLYLDTTFMNKCCAYIPSREDSFVVIIDLIEKTLLESLDTIIFIDYKVRYTLEALYHLIYLKFNIKVHVDIKSYYQLLNLDESSSFCMDPCNWNSRIHACYMDNHCRKNFEEAKNKGKLFTIIPTTLWWAERNIVNSKTIHYIDKFSVRVCFSHHSSFSEIIDFILKIHSKSIYYCVSQTCNPLKKM